MPVDQLRLGPPKSSPHPLRPLLGTAIQHPRMQTASRPGRRRQVEQPPPRVCRGDEKRPRTTASSK